MKAFGRFASFVLVSLASIVITITACGGGALPIGGGGGLPAAARAFIFNANPVGFHITRGFSAARASLHKQTAFTVNAQAPTPGGGNFPGFCNSVNVAPTGARAATVVYGLGLWTSGECGLTSVSDSDVGVEIPQAGQIGNVTVDAIGTGSGTDDGKLGIDSTASGQIQVTVLHADGTRTDTAITCALGVSNNAKVHCEDKQAAHFANVAAGDQVTARFWYNGGDSYRAIRVNLEYATPTF